MRIALTCRACGTTYPLDLPDGVVLGGETVTMALECCEDAAMGVGADVCPRCHGEGRHERQGSGRVDVCDLCGGHGRATDRPASLLRFVPVGLLPLAIGDEDVPF